MKKYYIIFLLSFLVFLNIEANAQKSNLVIKMGDKYYKDFNFSSALKYYLRADEKNPDNKYIKGRIGNCYKFLNKIAESEKWYADIANTSGSDNIYKFYYAQSLTANGKYKEALNMFNQYYKSEGKDQFIVNDFDNKIFESDKKVNIKLEEFNSEFAEFSPFKIRDILYFVSNRQNEVFMQREDVWTQRPFTQIFSVNVGDSTKKKIPKLYNSEVSKMYHEGPIGWDRNKNDLYITRSNYTKSKPKLGENKEVNLKIFKLAYVPEKSDFGSVLVDNLTFDNNNFSIAYPTVSADGDYMIFSSDMPGGFGGLDLYVAANVGGIWSNPYNLGDKINTPGNENFPYLLPDGLLYFSSDGHLGIGGLDIYSAELEENGKFGKVKNVRAPINSQFDDFGYWVSDNYSEGYFTSNRPSKFGNDDIYSFKKKAFMFTALIYDSKSEEKIDSAKIILTNTDTKKEIIVYSNSEGKVSAPIVPFSNYSIEILKDGYMPEDANFSTIDDEVNAEIPLVNDFGIVLEVTVLDADTKEEIPNAEVKIAELLSAEEEINSANDYGKTTFMLTENLEYRIRASKKLSSEYVYLAVSKDFNTYDVESPANLFVTIELRKVKKNAEIKIDNIYYDLGKYFIRRDAKPELNKLIKILNDNPGMDIELSSHTDCRGSRKSNAKLSAQRAEAAVNYLINNGINYRRLTATGYGETKILNGCECEGSVKSNCTEDQHQGNRRTVFSILNFD